MKRRQLVRILPDCEGYLASPEDVILGKLVFYTMGQSEKHLRDICGIFRVNQVVVDREYIQKWVPILGVTDAWNAIQLRLSAK
jgi:hypothetical protein